MNNNNNTKKQRNFLKTLLCGQGKLYSSIFQTYGKKINYAHVLYITNNAKTINSENAFIYTSDKSVP